MTTQQNPQEMEPIQLIWIDHTQLPAFSRYIPTELLPLVAEGRAMGALDGEGVACGALVFSLEEDCCQLRSLYVHPEYRRSYIGSTLLGELIEGIEATPEWDIHNLQVICTDSQEEGLFPFFQSLGFQMTQLEGQTCSIYVGDLAQVTSLQQKPAALDKLTLRSLSQLSDYDLKRLSRYLDQQQALYLPQGLTADSVLLEASFVAYHQNQLLACGCLSGQGESLVLSQFYVAKELPAASILVLSAMADQAQKSHPSETAIEIPLVTDSAIRLTQHFLKGGLRQSHQLYLGSFGLM